PCLGRGLELTPFHGAKIEYGLSRYRDLANALIAAQRDEVARQRCFVRNDEDIRRQPGHAGLYELFTVRVELAFAVFLDDDVFTTRSQLEPDSKKWISSAPAVLGTQSSLYGVMGAY